MYWLYHAVQTLTLVCLWPILVAEVLMSPKRRRTILQRLGFIPPVVPPVTGTEKRIWVHALSVGEVISAIPLLTGLRARFPQARLFLSVSTFTGMEIARRLVADKTDALFYFPHDTAFSVSRSLRRVAPDAVILVETDLWPHFLRVLAKRGIPAALVNARLSDRSFAGYRRMAPLFRPLFRSLAAVGIQGPADAERLRHMGVRPSAARITGNIKYDRAPPVVTPESVAELRMMLGIDPDRPVWVAGSTHEGEERVLSVALHRLRRQYPNLLLIVAPRDPERGENVWDLLQDDGHRAGVVKLYSRRISDLNALVIDRLGLLRDLYSLAGAAFVGGSLVRLGGHNPLEPAAVGVPVAFGPYMTDFRDVAASLIEAGGGVTVTDADSLADITGRWLGDPVEGRAAGERARAAMLANRGALDRTLDLLASRLKLGVTS